MATMPGASKRRSGQALELVEIHAVLAEYWAAVDRIGVARSPASFFAPGGELLLGSLEVRGRGEIEAFFRDRAATDLGGGRTTRHVLSNVRLEPARSEHIVAHATVLLFAGTGALPLPSKAPAAIGDFSFWCLEDAAYQWLFQRVLGTSVFVGEGASKLATVRDEKED